MFYIQILYYHSFVVYLSNVYYLFNKSKNLMVLLFRSFKLQMQQIVMILNIQLNLFPKRNKDEQNKS
jgi:hypothetical protein